MEKFTTQTKASWAEKLSLIYFSTEHKFLFFSSYLVVFLLSRLLIIYIITFLSEMVFGFLILCMAMKNLNAHIHTHKSTNMYKCVIVDQKKMMRNPYQFSGSLLQSLSLLFFLVFSRLFLLLFFFFFSSISFLFCVFDDKRLVIILA